MGITITGMSWTKQTVTFLVSSLHKWGMDDLEVNYGFLPGLSVHTQCSIIS